MKKHDLKIKRILFLDIDGVLNGHYFFKSKFRLFLSKFCRFIKLQDPILSFSPINLLYLRKLCKKFKDLEVVISSSWKYCWNEDGTVKTYDNKQDPSLIAREKHARKVDNILRKFCKCNIIGIIPNKADFQYKPLIDQFVCEKWLHTCDKLNFDIKESYYRGACILKYLINKGYINHYTREENEERYTFNINENLKMVIIEDDFPDVCCFKDLQPYVSITKYYGKDYGFRKEHYKQAVELLK